MQKSWFVSGACIVLAVALMIWGFASPQPSTDKARAYCVLMTDDYGTSALQFKQGAQEAAKQLGADVNFLTCARGEPVESELIRLIDAAVELPISGLVMPECSGDVLRHAVEAGSALKIPVVCAFDTEAPGTVSVASDDRLLGTMLTESARKRGAAGYAAFAEDDTAQRALIEGVKGVLGDNVTVHIEGPAGAKAIAESLPAGYATIALTPALTGALAISAQSHALWGIDPGEGRVMMLEKGAALGLGMRMPYAQGYQAMMAAAEPKPKGAFTPTRVITRDTMYRSENVKLMFPLLQ